MLSMCDQGDSIRLIFAAKEMLAEQVFDYHFLAEEVACSLLQYYLQLMTK
jgi:hypothetical protein